MSKRAEDAIFPEINSERWLSLENLPNEVWRAVPNYEDRYMVSNYGRVKSLEITITNLTKPNVRFYKQHYPEKILRPCKNHDGYLMVVLCKNGKTKGTSVHRLVALAFLDNPLGLPMVNHKDESKTNNCVYFNDDGTIDYNKSNLEWCDNKYNCNYGTVKERMSRIMSKPVQQYTLDGEFIAEFDSVKDASLETGLSVSRICDCCNRRKKSFTGGGFLWKYKNSNTVIVPRPKITQLTIEGDIVNTWNDVVSAANANKLRSLTGIYNCLKGRAKTAGGYIWKKI